jgi:transmembrane sensor
MTHLEIQRLIDNYLEGNCSEGEKKQLDGFLDSYQEESIIGHVSEEDKNAIDLRMRKVLDEQMYSEYSESKTALKISIKHWYKYAAVLAVGIISLLGIVYFPNQNRSQTSSDILQKEVVLQLSDGTKKIITGVGSEHVKEEKGIAITIAKNNTVVYQNSGLNSNKILLYNTLVVPYGKRFNIELSDGTKVSLNAGSTFRYPVQFIEGKSRQVFLDGEAFFKVAHNKKDAFLVQSGDLQTKVYGTQFNISSYKNDPVQDVVLVEGSVGVKVVKGAPKESEVLLKPNMLASHMQQSGSLVTQAVKVDKYIAWTTGVLFFKEERFGDILRRLQRHYDVEINNKNTTLEEVRFTGTFDVESITQVLDVFRTYGSMHYCVKGNKITITN